MTLQFSTFAYTGPNGGSDIPVANLALTAARPPVGTSGQALDTVGGPTFPPTTLLPATLDVPRKILQTQPLFGIGTDEQDVDIALTVPALTRAGT